MKRRKQGRMWRRRKRMCRRVRKRWRSVDVDEEGVEEEDVEDEECGK